MAAKKKKERKKIKILPDALFPLRKGKITPEIRQGIVNDFFVKKYFKV